jgi:hypothetical protein
MLLQRDRIREYAEYYQFHVFNPAHPGNVGDPGFWSPEAFANRFGYVDGTIGIGTESYDFVEVVVEIHDVVPDLSLGEWDHVIECDLYANEGQIGIKSCLALPEEERVFNVIPGNYRVRCCYANLDQGSDGITEREGGGDWYMVQCWPQEASPPAVLRLRPRAT